ncbi:tRNA glutamyl-Q(34) synthetase GluQRS [Aquibium carbonis]|uniref:tRNA glutamyl-Q(34) synthetase GluQRS n=1 Tax=Aquibium carbonis TaxID=2495581 RepID=A0A3R9YSJ7_9HYPH|nr:tRNA glutamyl-Q(34) synthetase GluQRS [Aquibium carbonis]RST86140.1 tRNA glutamyl-Q(34) synthetase GluQRS [Aquibium carbonis]
MTLPSFRFAPSPNGALHLGHAFSALLNARMAAEAGGRFLLRIEDIDTERCTRAFERGILEDLAWLGIRWEQPVRRQSEHFDAYAEALERLVAEGLAYPAFMSRGEVRAWLTEDAPAEWPRDPDGVPFYPPRDRGLPPRERAARIAGGEAYSWRLDMAASLERLRRRPTWTETGMGPTGDSGVIVADPAAWGDVVIARKDVPASYNLCVVVDDAIQGITNVVRGRDLFHATSVHRVLQDLLGLPAPSYHHHDLLLGEDGRKLSKSRGDTALRALRDIGATPGDIARLLER